MLTDVPPLLDYSQDLEGDLTAALTADLAWCLRRFVMGRADEAAMRRAEQALAAWEARTYDRDGADLTTA